MTVELKKQLEVVAGSGLPGTLTLNYPNATAVAEYLDQKFMGSDGLSPSRVVAGAIQETEIEVPRVADLSDADAREALFAELRALGGDFRQ